MNHMRRILFVVVMITTIIVTCSSSMRAYLDTNNKILLEVSLPKYSFKKFEPIEVLFKYINNGTQNDSIYRIFDDFLHLMKFNLIDEKGSIYKDKYSFEPTLGLFQKPEHIVKPNDTLIVLMVFNNYGRKASNSDSLYFYNNAYFPPGKYTGYAYVENDYNYKRTFNPPLKSNTIEFEIKDLNEEDKVILKYFKNNEIGKTFEQNKIDEILNDFSNNYFIEYIWREKIRSILRKTKTKEANNDMLAEAYKEFFQEYPNSFYNINFIPRYLNLVTNHNSQSIMTNIFDLIYSFPNTIISYYLKNGNAQNEIKRKILENDYHKY